MKQINQSACSSSSSLLSHQQRKQLPLKWSLKTWKFASIRGRVSFGERRGVSGEAGRGGQVCLAVPARFSFLVTFATPRLIIELSGRSARQEPRIYLVPPYALPALASISGELKSCFTDAIHGGRCSLITAALHVLLGTDCKARHPPTPHPPIQLHLGVSGIQRCWNQQADAD